MVLDGCCASYQQGEAVADVGCEDEKDRDDCAEVDETMVEGGGFDDAEGQSDSRAGAWTEAGRHETGDEGAQVEEHERIPPGEQALTETCLRSSRDGSLDQAWYNSSS